MRRSCVLESRSENISNLSVKLAKGFCGEEVALKAMGYISPRNKGNECKDDEGRQLIVKVLRKLQMEELCQLKDECGLLRKGHKNIIKLEKLLSETKILLHWTAEERMKILKVGTHAVFEKGAPIDPGNKYYINICDFGKWLYNSTIR